MRNAGRINWRLAAIGAAFFTVLGVVLAQGGTVTPFLLFCWVVSAVLVGMLLAEERASTNDRSTRRALIESRLDILLLAGLMLVAIWMQANAAPFDSLNSNPETGGRTMLVSQEDDGVLFRLARSTIDRHTLSAAFAALLVPAAYVFGRAVEGRVTGLLAALLGAVSGWTLALGRSGQVYPALAVMTAVYGAALAGWLHEGTRNAALRTGALMGIGWLVCPLFAPFLLLIPGVAAMRWLEKRDGLRTNLVKLLAAYLLAGVIALPAVVAPRPSDDFAQAIEPPLGYQTMFVEGLSRSMLLFVVESDPNPLHGIPNRAAFEPVLAVGFVIGAVVYIARVGSDRRAQAPLVLAALMIGLIPSASVLELPVRFPDLQRAAGALPVGLVIAAEGFRTLLQLPRRFLPRFY